MNRAMMSAGAAAAAALAAWVVGAAAIPREAGAARVQVSDPVEVVLTVTNREAGARTAEPITSGVPFAEGRVTDAGLLRLEQDGREIPAQFLVTARWPDRSIRWVLVDFQLDLPPEGDRTVTLRTGTAPQVAPGIVVRDDPGTLTVETQARTFVFAKSEFQLTGHRFHVRSGEHTFRATPGHWVIEEQGPLKVVVRVDGDWRDGSRLHENEWVRFRARLVFYRGTGDVRVFLTYRNHNSFGWSTAGEGDPRRDDVILREANFGPAVLLPEGAEYHVGSGIEKTWELDVPSGRDPFVRRTRFNDDGRLVDGDAPPRALAVAPPAYYASTRGWGRVALPVAGLDEDRQPDFDRYERLQRAKVDRAVVEDPPGLTGMTLWAHLARDLDSWQDYGDLRWDGNGCGTLSGNHYDWGYGMYLQFMRTGRLAFADAARVLLRHEIDFDIYHTERDGAAFNDQKNWEDRPSHNNPDNCFGPGRPSHTWSQGYALQWLLTGDHRGKDAFDEIQEGVRQYVYESFNGEGVIDTSEIRVQGWLLENLVNRWRIEPDATLDTSQYGPKPLRIAMQDVLQTVLAREAAAGKAGFVVSDDDEGGHLTQTIMHAYVLEPLAKVHDEVLAGRDNGRADDVLGLLTRMTRWLMSTTYGGDTNGEGGYRPRQIPYWVDTRAPNPADGQVPYVIMVVNAAGYLYTVTGDESFRDYARAGFRDTVRYVGAIGPDSYGDPGVRTPASYNSHIFPGTESKVQGWLTRYGQYFLASETTPAVPAARRH